MLNNNRARQKGVTDFQKQKNKEVVELERSPTKKGNAELRITSGKTQGSGDSKTAQLSKGKNTPMTASHAVTTKHVAQPSAISVQFEVKSVITQPEMNVSVKPESEVNVKTSPHHAVNKSMLETDEASAFGSIGGDDLDDRRTFNEIDIIGDLDRDDRGNLILTRFDGKNGQDRRNRAVNQYGYMIDLSGNIINNKTGRVAFAFKDLDEKGNIPMPYSVEKYNFNPFEMLGTFFYDDYDDPLSFKRGHRGGKDIDELGQVVSVQGFLQDAEGSLLDRNGTKRFDSKQFKQFGSLMPKLYTYAGKTFEIQEVMGVFDRDSNG